MYKTTIEDDTMEGMKHFKEWKPINLRKTDKGNKEHFFYALNQPVRLSDFKLNPDSMIDYAYKHRHLEGLYADFKTDSEGINYKYGVIIEKVNK